MRTRSPGGLVTRRLGGIKLRLAGIIMVAVLPLVAIRAVELYHERNHQIAMAGARALALAQRGAELYREPLVEAQTLLKVASHVPDVADGSPQACARFLELAEHGRDWANGLWVIAPDGRAVCTTVAGGLGFDVSQRQYFQQAMTTGRLVISDFFFSNLRGLPTSVVAYPVSGPGGEIKHVLAASLRLSWFSQLAAEVGRQADARVMLFDGQGHLLARYPERPEWIGKNWRGYPLMTKVSETREGWEMMESKVGPSQI